MRLGVGGDEREFNVCPEVEAAYLTAHALWHSVEQGTRPEYDCHDEAEILARTQDLISLYFAGVAREIAVSPEHDPTGNTPSAWLRHACKLPSAAAFDRFAVGQAMPKLVEATRAVEEGEIGFSHLTLIARTAEAVGLERFDEARLVRKARSLSPSRFRDFCHDYRHQVDRDTVVREEADLIENRYLELSTSESGAVWLKGWLDPVGGATLKTALESLARRKPGEQRPKPRRLADALVEIAGVALDAGTLPRQGGARPHLNVTATLETLQGVRGAAAGRLEFARPISEKAVERIACDCTVTRIVFGPESQVIEVGRARRVVTPAQRKALVARDGGCVWPGCDRPPSHTSVHHLIHWARGGTTDLPNEALVCGYHHFRLHEGGWTLIRCEDGALLPVPPTTLEREEPDWDEPPSEEPPDWLYFEESELEATATARLALTG